MYAYVTKTRIAPRRASDFVKTFFSSDSITNTTRIFVIGENDWHEKTGNVSFFVEISAFNQNYSVWQGQTHYSRTKDWRWRISEHRFNLTVLLHSEYVLARRKSRISCINGHRRTLTKRENCEAMFSENITIDHVGQITIELGDYFSFPNDFKKQFNDHVSELNSIFKVSLLPNSFHSVNYKIEMISY